MQIALESNLDPLRSDSQNDDRKKKRGRDSTNVGDVVGEKLSALRKWTRWNFAGASRFSCSTFPLCPFDLHVRVHVRTMLCIHVTDVGTADDFLGDCAKAAGCELLALSFPLRVRGVFFCLSTPTSSQVVTKDYWFNGSWYPRYNLLPWQSVHGCDTFSFFFSPVLRFQNEHLYFMVLFLSADLSLRTNFLWNQ